MSYATDFDAAMTEKFPGHTFVSSWNVFVGFMGGYQTVLDGDANNEPTNEMRFYASGWIDGYNARDTR